MTNVYFGVLKNYLLSYIAFLMIALVFLVILYFAFSKIKSLKKKRSAILIIVLGLLIYTAVKLTPLIQDLNQSSIVIEKNANYHLKYGGYKSTASFHIVIDSSNTWIRIPAVKTRNLPDKGCATIIYGKHSKLLLDIIQE